MRSKIAPILITLFFILTVYFTTKSVDPIALEKWVESAGVMGPLIIIFLTIITGVIAPISGSPVNFAGFILYGPNVVSLFAISGIISSAINFKIAKRWGRPIVQRIVGAQSLKTVDNFAKEHGLVSLFFMRIFLNGMHDFISYAMGLTSLKFWPYFIVTSIGFVPGTLMWYFVARISGDPFIFLAGTYVFAGAFTGVYLVYKFAVRTGRSVE